MASPASSEQYSYNSLNRLIKQDNLTLGKSVSYSHDPEGNRIQTVDPDMLITRYQYDVLNWFAAHVDPDERVNKFEYDPLGRVTAVKRPPQEDGAKQNRGNNGGNSGGNNGGAKNPGQGKGKVKAQAQVIERSFAMLIQGGSGEGVNVRL